MMDARKALEDIGLSVAEAEKNPGRVVKSFRERLVYEDQQTGKRKHWTQDDLARMVCLAAEYQIYRKALRSDTREQLW